MATNNGQGRGVESVLLDLPAEPLGSKVFAQQTPIITAALEEYCNRACSFNEEKREGSREYRLAEAAFHAAYESLMAAIDAHSTACVRVALEEVLSPQD